MLAYYIIYCLNIFMFTFQEFCWQKNNNSHDLLILAGGAAGHMAHPFDLKNIKTGGDLINFFNTCVQVLAKQPASLKIDGVNVSFKLIKKEDGTREFALDRGSMKPVDVEGITIDRLGERFPEGHGMLRAGQILLSIMNNSLPLIESELKELKMWNNSRRFLNTEFVESKTNVQEYDDNFLAIHGVNEFSQSTAKRRTSVEVPYSKRALESLVKKLSPVAKGYNFLIYSSVPANIILDAVPNYISVLNQKISLMADRETVITKNLNAWLSETTNPFDARVKTVDGKSIGAVSKYVYLHAINGKPISDIVGPDKDAQLLCINGTIMYHATRVLGNELLSNIETPMGPANTHEGIVLRDKSLGSKPVKITGEFIVRGMESAFRA
jgi:hypothetical protein